MTAILAFVFYMSQVVFVYPFALLYIENFLM